MCTRSLSPGGEKKKPLVSQLATVIQVRVIISLYRDGECFLPLSVSIMASVKTDLSRAEMVRGAVSLHKHGV